MTRCCLFYGSFFPVMKMIDFNLLEVNNGGMKELIKRAAR